MRIEDDASSAVWARPSIVDGVAAGELQPSRCGVGVAALIVLHASHFLVSERAKRSIMNEFARAAGEFTYRQAQAVSDGLA
jgi:hypothetical protein